MLRLRLLEEGMDVSELRRRFGELNVAALERRLEALAGSGALQRQGTVYRLEPSRVLTSNPIFAAVLEDLTLYPCPASAPSLR